MVIILLKIFWKLIVFLEEIGNHNNLGEYPKTGKLSNQFLAIFLSYQGVPAFIFLENIEFPDWDAIHGTLGQRNPTK